MNYANGSAETPQMVEFDNRDRAAISSACKILCSKYRGYVDRQDVEQELYLWLFTHYDRAERWREELEDKHAERTLMKALRNVGERYCRKEKAAQVGYDPEDESFYSIGMVADLLQLYFDKSWTVPQGLELTRTSGGRPPSEGGELMAMVADAGRAYEALPEPDRKLLASIYGGEEGTVADATAAQSIEWGISYAAASARIRRVVGRVRANLGGPSPY